MSSQSLIKELIKKHGGTQAVCAAFLGVSSTQISAWKKDGYMSYAMQEKIKTYLGHEDMDAGFVTQAGSAEDAKKWLALISYLAVDADQGNETGYDTSLTDNLELTSAMVFHALTDMGFTIPQTYPKHLELDFLNMFDGDVDKTTALEKMLEADPCFSTIERILKEFTNLEGFVSAYIYPIFDSPNYKDEESRLNIDGLLMHLAATKLDKSYVVGFRKKFSNFTDDIETKYYSYLKKIRNEAFRLGIPLKTEIMQLVYEDGDSLGQLADTEAEGFLDRSLHPDVYMNELLVNTRLIVQYLPAILKKLNISESEFKIDTSDLKQPRPWSQRNSGL